MSGAPATREQAWLGAALAVTDSLLGFATAWEVWSLSHRLELDAVDVVIAGPRAPRLAGVRGHKTLWLPPAHRARVGPLPVTSVARTLVDACGLVPLAWLQSAVKDALRRRLVTLAALARCVDSVPVSGRRKSRPIREVIAARIPGYDPGDSDPEADLVELLVRAGYPKPVQNFKVRDGGETYEVDVAWPDIKKGFEWDSLAFHADVFAFHRDRKKLRVLRSLGWDVVPVTSDTGAAEILAVAASFFSP